jgi:ATP-binding protein involved in chromosome partitioning
MPDKKYYIFGSSGCRKFAEALNIPFLGEIPIDSGIADSGDNGSPVALNDHSPVTRAFTSLAESVAQQVAVANSIREIFR